ncbi:MAG: hypothetical protein K0U98_03795 [Deltaproteobacteria bacterium]|nr:hypothetical protein [Deltaproteobacteria bacterium]
MRPLQTKSGSPATLSAKQVAKELEGIARLRDQLTSLQQDIEYKKAGGNLFYAIDFSEVYAFLYQKFDTVDSMEAGLPFEYESDKQSQLGLGLKHLFKSLVDIVFLLPPHAREMFAFIRWQQEMGDEGASLFGEARKALDGLSDEESSLLALFAAGEDISSPDRAKLIDLVKKSFESLCSRVSKFLDRHHKHQVMDVLNDLKQNGTLSVGIDELFQRAEVTAPDFGKRDIDLELKIFGLFPKKSKRQQRFAKLIDARALLYLRDINHQLEKNGARLLLVTRDSGLREVAGRLEKEPWFEWPNAGQFTRSVEAIFFDLMLLGTDSLAEKVQWIQETDELLGEIAMTLRLWQLEMRSSRHRSRSYGRKFMKMTADPFDRTNELWSQHRNIKLSLALKKADWLPAELNEGEGEDPRTSKSPPKAAGSPEPTRQGSEIETKELTQLRRLWKFVSTPEYAQLAEERADGFWGEFREETMRLLFIGRVSKEGVEKVIRALSSPRADGQEGGLALSTQSDATICRVEFRSQTIRDLLLELDPWQADTDARSRRVRRAFDSVMAQALTGPPKAEEFLFMALILGMVQAWDEAYQLAEESHSMNGETIPGEIHFFQAVALHRQEALTVEEHARNLRRSYQHLLKARQEKLAAEDCREPEEARLLKEQALVALIYNEQRAKTTSSRGGTGTWKVRLEDGSKIPAKKQALKFLHRALQLASGERKLTIEILNNLAYAELEEKTPDLEATRGWFDRIDKEFAEAAQSERRTIPNSPWPALRETRTFYQAHRAHHDRDSAALQRCRKEFRQLIDNKALPPQELDIVGEHLELAEQWLEELERGEG